MVLDKQQAIASLSKATLAFIGTISEVIPGISTRSMPPINNYTVKFNNIRALRGSGFATDQFSYQQRGAGMLLRMPLIIPGGVAQSANPPEMEEVKVPTVGVQYLACLKSTSHIDELVEVDQTIIDQMLRSANLPLGWQKNADGRLESPWQQAKTKQAQWYQQSNYGSAEKCSKTGRPLLTTGEGVTLKCETVQANNVYEFKNPDGDGVFKLTVTNGTNHDVEIPALLRDPQSKQILWEESVFVKTDAGNHFFPGQGNAKNVEATVLHANQSVSGKLDTLTLKDLNWPQGGWRLNLQFCLGDKATDGNYYYFTDHHEPIRHAAERKNTAVIE